MSDLEQQDQESQTSRRLGIYLLPNLFTTISLFAGFYAVIAAMNHQFSQAALAIIAALLFDSLDGRVARLINAQSDFGGHYDSLSDLVSFGVSPALVLYNWSLVHLETYHLGKIAWLSAFLYVACVALRLAKFNSISPDTPGAKRYFFGLPCPAAAAMVAMIIFITQEFGINGIALHTVMTFVTVILALLMVSNIKYRSFKDFNLQNRIRFTALLLIVIVVIAITIVPIVSLFVMITVYVLSGPFFGLLSLKGKARRKAHEANG